MVDENPFIFNKAKMNLLGLPPKLNQDCKGQNELARITPQTEQDPSSKWSGGYASSGNSVWTGVVLGVLESI